MKLSDSRFALIFLAVLLCVLGAAVGCDGDRGTSKTSVATPSPSPRVSVVSSIKSGAVLSKPLLWSVRATVGTGAFIDHVDFLIDGKVRWTEHEAPYEFNEGGLFAPWPLRAGSHTLATLAVTSTGSKVEDTARVKIRTQAEDAALPTGTYFRTVAKADARRVRNYRTPPNGAFGELPETGRWGMRVRPDGVLVTDIVTGTQFDNFYLPYRTTGGTFKVYGVAIWLQPHPDQPSKFCDPESSSSYRWVLENRDLTITPIDHRCADRDMVLAGTWHRG